MAQTFQEIFGESIKSVKQLRDVIKDLQGDLIGVTADSEQFKDITEKLSVAQDELSKVTAKTNKEMVAADDSITGMERQYKQLYNTYKSLSEEMRNSDFGKQTAESLKSLSEKLNQTKMDAGNFKDNIGHYSEGVIDAFGKMGLSLGSFQKPFETLISVVGDGKNSMEKSLGAISNGIGGITKSLASMGGPAAVAKTAIQGVGAALKTLIANPVGAIIMAIVVAFKALQSIATKVKEAINANEDSQMQLKEAMSAFQPVVDAVSNAFDKLGQIVVKAIGFIGDAFRKLREIGGAVTDFLGITDGANKRIKEQNKLYKDLAKSQNELTKNKRENQKLNAKENAEVQRLKEEASEATTLAEKKRLLTEAKEKQAEIDNRNIAVAKEELRILEEQSKLTANDAAMNDKLAAAVAAVSNAEATAAQNMRNFNKQLNGGGGLSAGIGAVKNYRKEAKELYEQLIEDGKDEVTKLTEKYEKEKKLLEKYHYDTTLLTQQYENKKAEIVAESASKMRTAVLRNMQYDRDALSRYGETLTGVAKAAFDKKQVENDIRELEGIKDKATELYNEWVTGYYLDPVAVEAKAKVKGVFSEVSKETKEAFKDMFKEGTDFDSLEYPLKDIKALFDKAGLITGDDIIDIESIDLNIKILKNRIAALEDNIVSERLSFKNSSSDLEYYKSLLGIIDDENLTEEESSTKIAELGRANLEERKKNLEEELAVFKGSKEMELELTQQYYETVAKLRENDLALVELSAQRTEEAYSNVVKSMSQLSSSFGSIIGSQKTIIDQQVKDGKISDEQAKKKKKNLEKLAEIQKNVAIVGIAADTAGAIMGIWKAYAAEKVANAETAAAAGPAAAGVLAGLNIKSLISAIAQTVGIGANAIAQIQAARAGYVSTVNSLRDESGGGGAASVASVSTIESQPFSYTRSVQTTEEEDRLNQPIYVTVTDIEDGLNKAKVTDKESKF